MNSSCFDESSINSISSTSVTDSFGSGSSAGKPRRLPSSKYKGVVPQPNGRWGAQIYENHQRVWLGTFNEEPDAAKAYDLAVQRFRGRGAVTNFKSLLETGEEVELLFLNSHSKAETVDMLRRHTYCDELLQSKQNYDIKREVKKKMGVFEVTYRSDRGEMAQHERLFDKVVTPSDVGKPNRLVIPKKYAEKHLPWQIGSDCKDMLLKFEDADGKVWRFRYSYWNSSQSYVLTKGWNHFVEEKGLKAGDIVSFWRSTGPDKRLYINSKARSGGYMALHQPVQPLQVVRLFGVNILKIPVNSVVNGKRMREELLPFECRNKQFSRAL